MISTRSDFDTSRVIGNPAQAWLEAGSQIERRERALGVDKNVTLLGSQSVTGDSGRWRADRNCLERRNSPILAGVGALSAIE